MLLNCHGSKNPIAGSHYPDAPRETALNILQKYILREWFWTFAAISLVLLVVMFGVTVGELFNDIAGGRVPLGLLGSLLLLKMPDVFNTLLPLSVFVAVIWGQGRLYRDQEMVVMRASGFRWKLMLRPLFNLLIPVAVVVFALGVFFAPLAARTAQAKLENAFRTAAEWGLQTGRFHVLKDGDLILYVEAVEKDGRTLRNIFIQQRQGGREQIWIAEKGYYWLDASEGMRYLTLENGQITEGGSQGLDFGIVRFSRNDIRLPEPQDSNKPLDVKLRPSSELIFSGSPAEAAQMQWRISPAITVVVLGLLALPLAHSAPRESRGGRILFAILTYAIYANVLHISRYWIERGVVPPLLGMWWVHLLVLAIAIMWLRRLSRTIGGG
jgi:lipopolysaccharide export system permease protein